LAVVAPVVAPVIPSIVVVATTAASTSTAAAASVPIPVAVALVLALVAPVVIWNAPGMSTTLATQADTRTAPARGRTRIMATRVLALALAPTKLVRLALERLARLLCALGTRAFHAQLVRALRDRERRALLARKELGLVRACVSRGGGAGNGAADLGGGLLLCLLLLQQRLDGQRLGARCSHVRLCKARMLCRTRSKNASEQKQGRCGASSVAFAKRHV
jgi:hypothetical protein